MKLLRRVRLFVTLWTVAYHVPSSMGFSTQEYWSGLPFPSPRDLPNPGIEPGPPALQADTLSPEPPGKPMNQKDLPYGLAILLLGIYLKEVKTQIYEYS